MIDTIYKTEEKAFGYLSAEKMTTDGDHVLVGLSGGADSVCLLLLLLSLKDRLGIRVSAVHVNHGLRENAARDEAFCKALCEKEGVTLQTVTEDVKGRAVQEKCGLEEAARLCRYEALYREADRIGATQIAAAHHKSDQAETLLFSLCRGTGITGMAGMHPVSGRLIRPLLCFEREEILSYLAAKGQDYVTDETNADNRYARNLIRNEVLPLLSSVNANAVAHLAMAAERMRLLSGELSEVTKEALSCCILEEAGSGKQDVFLRLSIEKLLTYRPFLQKEIIREAVYRAAGARRDLTAAHIDAVYQLTQGQSGRKADLPYGVRASRSFDELILSPSGTDAEGALPETAAEEIAFCLTEEDLAPLLSGEKVTLQAGDETWILSMPDLPPAGDLAERIPRKPYTKWMDYDRIVKPVSIRRAEKGDWFYFDGSHKKTAESYFKEQKLSAARRAEVYVAASGMQILGFFPGRLSQAVLVSGETKRILQIERRIKGRDEQDA